MSEPIACLALDIGGANIKAAHSLGTGVSRPFAVWKHPERLASELADIAQGFPPIDRVLVTMTAELCDCFVTKREGVGKILDAVSSVFGGRTIEIWGTDGRFHAVTSIRSEPLLAAASNWLALATVAAGMASNLLIDVGSTTTDLISLARGSAVPVGRTDTDRLGSGELIYVGVRRTPVCALATHIPFRGTSVGLAAELFATTLDIYLTLRAIPENPLDHDTADGRPATIEAARDRLARMVGADREGFSTDDAVEMSRVLDAILVSRLVEAAESACVERFGKPGVVVVSGSGAFLGERVAVRILAPRGRVIRLADVWGEGPAEWGCASALLRLNRGEKTP